VLALAVSEHLYPRLDDQRFGAGALTKIRAQVVSGRSCQAVAERLGLPERFEAAAPESARPTASSLAQVEHVVSDALEAVIAACFLHFGYEPTAAAVVEAFEPEIREALENPLDAKSALQELLARDGRVVVYVVHAEHGPPHDRTFDVRATVDGRELGEGSGRSKKDAEQEAAREALERLERNG
jgi:ribonuclease-3